MEFWSGLVGAAVGGGFALAGAWLQGRQSRQQAEARRKDDQRRGWFDDLRRVYEEVGRHYAVITAACATYIQTREATVRVPNLADNLHAEMLLHMHGASDEVLAASDAFIAVDREVMGLPTVAVTSDHYSRMLDALGEFYTACGSHLDEVWPTGDDGDEDGE